MDFTLARRKIDLIQGHEAGKPFGNTQHFKDG
jgi:hypothetical protein